MKYRLLLPKWASAVRSFSSASGQGREGPPFNILFFGTDSFALQTLKSLQVNRQTEGRDRVVDQLHVVSNSDKSHVASFARKQNLELLAWPLSLDDLDRYDLGVLVSFGRLVPRKVISKFPHGILNVHPSLLPRWRGASPIMHTVLNADQETGVSIMTIQPQRFDTGSLVRQTRLPVPQDCTAKTLGIHLAKEGAELLMKTLSAVPSCLQDAEDQRVDGVTYAHKATAAMSDVNWAEQTCQQIKLQYRALAHMFPLRTRWAERAVKLTDMVLDSGPGFEPAAVRTGQTSIQCSGNASAQVSGGDGDRDGGTEDEAVRAGAVCYDQELQAVCVRCRDGWVAFRSVVVKKKMAAVDFHNGYLSKDKRRGVHFHSHPNGLFGARYLESVKQPQGR